jgi:hypothetical protein
MTTQNICRPQDGGSEDRRNVEDEKIPHSWVGQRIDLIALDANPSVHTEIEGGAVVYDLGVRHIPGLLLKSVTERGIVIERALRQPEGTRFFRPWGSVLSISLSSGLRS